jgi:hypothetical protein
LIGKTALALVAAAMIAAAAVLLVWAAGFALYGWLVTPYGSAAAAAAVAGAAAIFIGIVLLVANSQRGKERPRERIASPAQSLLASFGETIKDRPLLTLGLTLLTGVAATRDPNMLKDLWSAILQRHDDDDR